MKPILAKRYEFHHSASRWSHALCCVTLSFSLTQPRRWFSTFITVTIVVNCVCMTRTDLPEKMEWVDLLSFAASPFCPLILFLHVTAFPPVIYLVGSHLGKVGSYCLSDFVMVIYLLCRLCFIRFSALKSYTSTLVVLNLGCALESPGEI